MATELPPNENSEDFFQRIYSKNKPTKKPKKGGDIKPLGSISKDKADTFIEMLKSYKYSPSISKSNLSAKIPNIKPGEIFNGFDTFYGTGINGNAEEVVEKKDTRFVLFYGFNGLLAQKYSIIDNMTTEEVRARMAFAGDKVPWKLEHLNDFTKVKYMFEGSMNALTEITFDDAMTKIRIGTQVEKVEVLDEPEEDEFDEDCIEECIPGKHKCGK